MKVRKDGSRVLRYEGFGFLLIIVLAWLNQLADLPRYLVGGPPHAADFRDSIVQTLIVLVVGLVVLRLTRRLVERLHYLEGLLRVCAWCRKIGYNNEWIRIEEYFAQGFHIQTTHGMCPDCLKKMEEDTTTFLRRETQDVGAPPKAEAA